MRLMRLRRRLYAAQIVQEFRTSNDKELKKLRNDLKRPMMEERWRKTREAKVEKIEKNRRSSDALLSKREELYQRYLVADRQEDQDEAIRLTAKIEALDWVTGGRDDI